MIRNKCECVCLLFLAILIFRTPCVWGHDLPSKDMSDYITPYDYKVVELAESIGMKPFLSYPLENARIAYYWVSENIRYQYDNQTWGKENGDYWQLPSTTLKLRTGDCEDQAILLASLLRALRLPRENVRVAVSYTRHHAWCEIKIPLPIYGLENIAANSLELLLKNKKVTVSTGESSVSIEIGGSLIDEIKAAGLNHNDGWIPIDTTFKIVGLDGSFLPIPFSWWLTYGYNVYKLFGYTFVPERTFQDKARTWTVTKEIRPNENITFEIPCFEEEKIIGVAKALGVWKERTLVSTGGFDRRAGYDGPFYIKAGEKLKVEWVADRPITVYILNELDFKRWIDYYRWTGGGPTSWRTYKHDDKGSLEYLVEHPDNYYVIIYVLHTILGGYPARIYSWIIKHSWQETACNIQISVSDPQGESLISYSITRRNVEKRFEFTARKTGIYRIVFKNLGVVVLEPVLLYTRLEAFQPPLSAEFFSVNENLAADEQRYVNTIAKSLTGGMEPVWDNSLNWAILFTSIVIALLTTLILLRKRARKWNSEQNKKKAEWFLETLRS